ncbi:alpha/beta hydrolase [Sphingomonas ginkgonis]|uniref:Alpha/beta hydrolase n=2 Tax=Sphingomonas ginkgonis TaxID=2315330 RepID=A0A3R9WUL8_9SPHN|nr:alpha/beta hydrolase [Sphingomonas ginkgonis]
MAPAAAQPAATPSDLARIFTFTRIPAVAEPRAIPLIATPSGSAGTEQWDRMGNGQRVVRNVTAPTLTPFLPAPGKATGTAVIVAPGGGFTMLSMDNEGWPVAQWLADHGVAAFVLKYRLLPTPADEAGFSRQVASVMAAAAASKAGPPDIQSPASTTDALAALRMVRARAGEWGVDPRRVGMIGFSAGAMTTMRATLSPDAAARPDFIGYVYGPMRGIQPPAGAPPMFAALANDDGLFGGRGFEVVERWRAAGRPVELHAYEAGDHGFGMGKPGTTTTLLMPEFLAWMEARGLLRR